MNQPRPKGRPLNPAPPTAYETRRPSVKAALLDLQHFPPGVIPARRAGAMRQHRLFALRARNHLHRVPNLVVRSAAAIAAHLRRTFLGNSHGDFLSAKESQFSLMSFSAASLGSSTFRSWPQSFSFKFCPHAGQRPLQSALQVTRIGNASSTCSRSTSSSRSPSP